VTHNIKLVVLMCKKHYMHICTPQVFQITKGLGQNLTTSATCPSTLMEKFWWFDESIATGPFKFSLYLNLAFKTYQETYQIFCIIRRLQRVSTPYRKTLCCCPLSFQSSRNTRDHDPRFDNQEQFAFYVLDFSTEAPVMT